MKIHDYFYNEETKRLYIEFSTKKDGDKFYRILDLDYSDVGYYSPNLITEDDLLEMDEMFVIDLINGYIEENGSPDEMIL